MVSWHIHILLRGGELPDEEGRCFSFSLPILVQSIFKPDPTPTSITLATTTPRLSAYDAKTGVLLNLIKLRHGLCVLAKRQPSAQVYISGLYAHPSSL